MIIRVWNGWADNPENAEAYEELLNGAIAPGIVARGITGQQELTVLRRRRDEHPGHFLTLMTFADWAAVEEFAGPGPTSSVVPPAARALLSRFDRHSRHFELLHRHLPGSNGQTGTT